MFYHIFILMCNIYSKLSRQIRNGRNGCNVSLKQNKVCLIKGQTFIRQSLKLTTDEVHTCRELGQLQLFSPNIQNIILIFFKTHAEVRDSQFFRAPFQIQKGSLIQTRLSWIL